MFPQFAKAVHDRFVQMSDDELFVVDAPDIWEVYLASFPEGTNPILRQRRVYDCQMCKQFIRRLGGVITINDGVIGTVWDVPILLVDHHAEVSKQMHEYVCQKNVVSIFRTKEKRHGVEHNYDAESVRYDHFYGETAAKHYHENPDSFLGEIKTTVGVMHRGLQEISEADIVTVLDLIDNNQLYRGEEHKGAILGFQALLRNYKAKSKTMIAMNRFLWENVHNRSARFRNTVIGTLLTDLSSGVDLEQAVKSFESKVAPTNYKRPSAVITQRMVEDAVSKLNDLGLGGSIYRRYAQLSDISINDVLFVDNGIIGKMKDGITALLESSIVQPTVNTKNATGITADAFIEQVLPTVKKIEVFVENRHTGNFVSLTAPKDGGQQLFRWNNNYAWSYDGDVADSVKQRVKAAGGKIDCDLRISLSWFNTDDLDLHAQTPRGHIYYGSKMGILDVDMNAHNTVRNPVENLAFNRPQDGQYRIWVDQFRRRESSDTGFAIEIETGGILQQFSYSKMVKDTVPCFDFLIRGGKVEGLQVSTGLVGGSASQEKWGIKTEALVPVQALMYSPNYWVNAGSSGAKHLIFALENCRNPGETRGIYNEFLRPDLEKHRKVFEVLGSKTKCAYSENQVSGLGFTAARGDSVVVVVDGRRTYNLTF